jgi:hypothetical protein
MEMTMYDANNIYWFIRSPENSGHPRDKELTFWYGRCRSGQRWFWVVSLWNFDSANRIERYGWVDNEARATG